MDFARSPSQKHGDVFLVILDIIPTHCGKFQLVTNFYWVLEHFLLPQQFEKKYILFDIFQIDKEVRKVCGALMGNFD